jgi:hypothetical protein
MSHGVASRMAAYRGKCLKRLEKHGKEMAGTTGLEPATSDVTGRRSNQLSYVPAMSLDNQIVTRTRPVHQIARRGIL